MTAAFIEALLDARRPVIMELKRQDATGADLFGGRSAARLVADYQEVGAPCLSVVTGRWFGGTPELLREVVAATDLPVLQKDFITRRSQLHQARESGAAAVLLTAALLPRATLGHLVELGLSLGLTPFVEVVTEEEISRVPRAEECVIAVNNKDIGDRERGAGDLGRSSALLPAVLGSGTRCPVSAGAVRSPEDAARLLQEGFAGVLVGTGLLLAPSLPGWLDGLDAHRGTASALATNRLHPQPSTSGGNGMTSEAPEQWKVVVNDEEQYSIWSADRETPAGWHEDGVRGAKDDCLAHIERVWTDMRPRSLRLRSVPEEGGAQ